MSKQKPKEQVSEPVDFNKLLQKVVSVPKREVMEKLKKEKEERKKKKQNE